MVKPSWRAKSTATRCQPRIRHGPAMSRRAAGAERGGVCRSGSIHPRCGAACLLTAVGRSAQARQQRAGRFRTEPTCATGSRRGCVGFSAVPCGVPPGRPDPKAGSGTRARRPGPSADGFAAGAHAAEAATAPPCGSYPYPLCGGAGRGLLAGGLPPFTPRTTGAFPPARRRGARRRPSRQGRCGRRSPPRRRRACRDPSPARTGRRRACG